MIVFYLIAFIPIIVGGILWASNKEFVWWEWAISSGIALLTAFIINAIAISSMTKDTETWSGYIRTAVFQPKWVEEYQQMHTRIVGSGKYATTQVYYTTEHRTHPDRWYVKLNYGSVEVEKDISRNFYNEIKDKWGGKSCLIVRAGVRSGYDSGDKNDYILANKTSYIYPTTMMMNFENRIKAAPTTFSFVKVPESAKVFQYPNNSNWRTSNRLLGLAKSQIDILEWDRLNTELGSSKKVNLILIGFGENDSSIAQYQEAAWIGGKKNDLVICYGGKADATTWSYVFGWTEKEPVKRNLESIMLNNKIDNSIIPKIKDEVVKNYKIKEWEKFSYISIQPPFWSYLVMIAVTALSQLIIFCISLSNNSRKN